MTGGSVHEGATVGATKAAAVGAVAVAQAGARAPVNTSSAGAASSVAGMSTVANNPWRMLAAAHRIRTNTTVVVIPEISDRLLDPIRFSWDLGALKAWCNQQFQNKRKDRQTGWPIDLDGTVIAPEQLYPEWRFNHQVERDGTGFTMEGRNSFLCVHEKMVEEELWSEVLTVYWVGPYGEILFRPRREAAELQAILLGKGYGDWWMASKDFPWGVRSHLEGVQLHFRYDAAHGFFNAHIDLHNPGDTKNKPPSGWVTELPGAIRHWWFDTGRQRKKTHSWQELATALRKERRPVITVP